MKTCLIRLCFIVAILGHGNLHAETLGRLFTSPDERKQLDELRTNQDSSETFVPVVPTSNPTVTTTADELRFSGFIKRADGSYAIWVNGQSNLSNQDSQIEQAQFLMSPEATLTAKGQEATMKPGQIWSLESNTIREGYYRDRIQAQSKSAEETAAIATGKKPKPTEAIKQAP